MFAQTFIETLVVVSCYKCGVNFGMTQDVNNRRLRDGGDFYCPNGHVQHYVGKTDAQKLKDAEDALKKSRETVAYWMSRNDQTRAEVEHQKNRIRGYQGALAKAKNGARATEAHE